MNDQLSERQEPLPARFEATVTDKQETGIRLFGLEDKQTGITTYFAEFNEEFDVHAGVAWSGARTSRSDKPYDELFAEITDAIHEGRYSAGKKLSNVFVNYGHASVADMAPVMIYANRLPMHEAFWIFNHTSVGAGQELSTRYVEIEDLDVPSIDQLLGESLAPPLKEELERSWQDMQSYLSHHYAKWSYKLRSPLEDYLSEHTDEDINQKTVDARVLDVARMWIPAGARTSMTLLSSARNFVDLSSQLKSTGNEDLAGLGDQIVTLLKLKNHHGLGDMQAELGELTKYHEGSDVLQRNLRHVRQYALGATAIREFLPQRESRKTTPRPSRITELDMRDVESHGELLLVQQLLTAFPNAKPENIIEYVRQLDDSELEAFGSVIFADHTHHELMRNAADHRGAGYLIETALAYHRDYNRHRSMGRLVLALETDDFSGVLGAGPNQNYQLRNSRYWSSLEEEWSHDMGYYYEQLYNFTSRLDQIMDSEYDQRFLINMLPLGHQVRMLMSGPISQWQYFSSLRIGLGGDFGYRAVAWDILEHLREDPILRHMNGHLAKPDPNDIEQVLGRS